MDLRNIIIQGGLMHREVQKYDREQEKHDHDRRLRESGVKRLEAQDSLLEAETNERRETLQGNQRGRDRKTQYEQLVSSGASFADLAEAARKAGDIEGMNGFRTAHKQLEQEGLKNVVIAALSGASDAELEQVYNQNGSDRIDPGTVKMDRKTGFVSYSQNGQQRRLNLSRLAELLGVVKRQEPKQTVVPAGAQLAVDGQIVATNTAGVEAKAEADRRKLDHEYGLRRQLESFKSKHGDAKATALIQNMEYLVKSGVAADSKDAFSKLRTTMEKPEEDAILSLATTLVKGNGYRGRDGLNRAMKDAGEMVRAVRGGTADSEGRPATESKYGSADDVRAAFRAGKIDRATAESVLKKDFGFK